ncbi:putative ATPase component of ABC transporters with duplicated ATPase domains [Xenorhabdus bovienii str. Jollieti]|uniref:Putative ATPase component of ABC transporters with duplicated ATPase domains n=1 Tax=Xenorhabdus bovienii (strain SS-2004) TaxID=406818 RepID=D3V4K5_XENBS|nr:ATP-binding cassette domain-containing protein [Xenorhabdus bovienii]CBJ82584.1 putative ATPase component of ABC transporters with duplicated ATPase domains [Xenorhabdus bovienii SS-2004]CDH28384.1 putative ATPase component of ABC transporters with duplicated ATPase domains [Xenorhabdus bovienii str. Jollieti]
MQSESQPLIEAKQIAYQFSGEIIPLFSGIDMVLNAEQHALVGRNGIGKSWLASILARQIPPTEGSVNHFRDVGYLSQGLTSFSGNAAEMLGLTEIMNANERILAGVGDVTDFDIMENHWDWQFQAESLLAEGELRPEVLKQPFSSLSGGEQTRLRLLALKYQGAEFMILDEPSNHLDRQGRLWLAQWLTNFSGGILLITHDPQLLQHVSVVYELSGLGLCRSTGGWETWLESKEQLRLGVQREVDQTRKNLKQALRDKQKDREKASKRQSQGKQRRENANQSKIILDRELGRSEATLSRQAKQHEERLQRSTSLATDARARLEIIDPLSITVAAPQIAPAPLLYLQNVILPFGSGSPISLTMNHSDRLAITGKNGSGKSTLLKVMAGLFPTKQGTCRITPSYRLMDQHFSFLDKNQSALHNFQLQSPGWPEDRYRTRLAQLRIRGEEALKPVGYLSGGEQLKVALACLFCGPYAPALLLLDEPDNHLDIESRELLQKALHSYTGAMVLISHDAQFIANIGNMQELLLGSSEDFLHKKTLKSFSER